MMKQLGTELWTRVILSYKSTLIGIGLAIAVEIFDIFTNWLSQVHPATAHSLAGIILLIGMLLKEEAAKFPAPPPEASPAPPPKPTGHAAVLLLIALAVVFLGLARIARADSIGGGCSTNAVGKLGIVCGQPDLAASLVEVNLKSGSVVTSVDPMLGYGVTIWSDKWYTTGLAAHVGFRNASDSTQRILPEIDLSFAKYVRIGIGKPFKGDGATRLFLGLGASLGAPGKG